MQKIKASDLIAAMEKKEIRLLTATRQQDGTVLFEKREVKDLVKLIYENK